jgi:hypothetical protein
MFLQHDNARPHTSAATSAAVDSSRFVVVPHPPYSPDLASSDFWLFRALKKHLKGYCLHVMKKVKLLRQNGFKNGLKNSTTMGSRNLFSAGSVVSNEGGTMWKHEV